MDKEMRDLRGWLERVEEMGELRMVEGAHWRHELGGIADLMREERQVPAVLFDAIGEHPRGYRVLSNPFHSIRRVALTLGLPLDATQAECAALWRERRKDLRPLPLRFVSDGPVLEHVQRGEDVNVLAFPSPIWRELDGGRYVGTADTVLTRDPDEGWINAGTYRVMVVDERHVTVYMDPGRHGRLHMERAFARGDPFPVMITAGQHPLLFLCACTNFLGGADKANEFEMAGGIRGEPIEVIEGEATGLPFPAHAEIAIEAIARPGETHPEGPFAEFTGYYASGTRAEPLFEVQRIYHRTDPIILGDAPPNPRRGTSRSFGFFLSSQVWDVVEAGGVPNVKAIVSHAASGGGQFVVISIEQAYPGHAKQAAGVVAMSRSTGNAARYIVVVDDDIDPYDLGSVIWAISNRADPARDIDLIHDTVGSPLDPLLNPAAKERGEFYRTKAIINACKPYEWKDRFPPVNEMSAELRQRLLDRWGSLIRGEAQEERQPVPELVGG